MSLTSKAKKELKAKAHKLKPVVHLGNNGITPNLLKEIDRALHDHELIKIRMLSTDRETRQQFFQEISATLAAEPVQLIGFIGILYRRKGDSGSGVV